MQAFLLLSIKEWGLVELFLLSFLVNAEMRGMFSFMPQPIYCWGRGLQCLLKYAAGWVQYESHTESGGSGREECRLPRPYVGGPACKPVAVLTVICLTDMLSTLLEFTVS
jgi:hypothetical protein